MAPLETTIPFEYLVWDARECATYCRVSKEHFLRSVRHAAGFPSPITNEHEQPRWRAKSVAAWRVKEAA